MTFTPAGVIEVAAWGRLVGAVARDPQTGLYAFEYDDGWLEHGVELSPLHLPRRRGVFEFPELRRETFHGLPAMLADALPDRFGSALVNAWMAAQGIEPALVTPLDRLAYAGDRAMGALSFAPPAAPSSSVSLVQVADLVAAARAELAGTLDERGVHDALAQLITVGSSAGGARAKAVIAYNPATDQMRSGQLHAPEGFEQWILKLDGVGAPGTVSGDPLAASQPYCRVEFAYYLMATRAGIEMSESRLLSEGPRAHFMTKRFDRGPNDQRIHMQSLCALAHLDYNLTRTHSYSSYFQTAQALGLGRDARQQLFRRVAFNEMAVNRDDHTKNFAFLLPEGGTWALAPDFDVTHSNWTGEWTAAHQMSVNGKFVDVTLDDLRALGDLHDVPGIDVALTEVADAVHTWSEVASEAGLDQQTTDRIAADVAAHWPR